MPSYVLDTSAVLTLLNNEEGTETVLGLLEDARSGNALVYIPFMALMELEYQNLRRFGPGETQRVLSLVSAWPVEIEHSTMAWRHEAATIKATAPVSVADAWICGLARLLNAELVHKDPEYDTVHNLKALQLPYKHKNK
jgi:predicted nucleic acid-binding protein